jgi:putative transposase
LWTLATAPAAGNCSFQTVLSPFLQQPGLPFAQILSAADIQQAFADVDGLFAQDDIYSTQIVLWAFLAQVLQEGKQAACASAVAQIATYCHQMDLPVPCGDTGDYCRARAKLQPAVLRRLVQQTAEDLEQDAPAAWLWHGLHAKLVDGFTFTMMDTPANQHSFPQQPCQKPGVGLPIARACAILSLATAAILDLAVGPYEGKETGEPALLRRRLDCLGSGDLVVFDRCFCSYMMLALLLARGVQICTRLHQGRDYDFRRGQRLGEYDHLITWKRPERPDWMSPEEYAQIPESLTLRELQFTVSEPGYRSQTITVVTTLTDPDVYPKEEIATLFGYRWNAELDIEAIKQTLHLDHVLCKSPAMVQRQVWVTLLAYNLIRTLIATAAAEHHKQPRQVGFTLACQTVLWSWMLLSTGVCRDAAGLWKQALARIAANEVANRPGRIEPRVVKRRPPPYRLMQQPREKLRALLLRNPRACDKT